MKNFRKTLFLHQIRQELNQTLLDIEKCRSLMTQYPDIKLEDRYDELWVKADLLASELKNYGREIFR